MSGTTYKIVELVGTSDHVLGRSGKDRRGDGWRKPQGF